VNVSHIAGSLHCVQCSSDLVCPWRLGSGVDFETERCPRVGRQAGKHVCVPNASHTNSVPTHHTGSSQPSRVFLQPSLLSLDLTPISSFSSFKIGMSSVQSHTLSQHLCFAAKRQRSINIGQGHRPGASDRRDLSHAGSFSTSNPSICYIPPCWGMSSIRLRTARLAPRTSI
jgi:hypothetical protein